MGLNLMGFGRSVRDTSLVGDPVDFPSLATIGGEGLLKVGGIGRDLGPNIAHQNDPAVEGFLVEKFATAVGKLANRRLPERTILAVGPVETPLMGLRIVETEGQTLDVTGRAGGLELFEPSAAIPDFAGDGRAVKLNPGRRAGQGMEETLEANFPGAGLEVKIVLAIAWRGGRSGSESSLRGNASGAEKTENGSEQGTSHECDGEA